MSARVARVEESLARQLQRSIEKNGALARENAELRVKIADLELQVSSLESSLHADNSS